MNGWMFKGLKGKMFKDLKVQSLLLFLTMTTVLTLQPFNIPTVSSPTAHAQTAITMEISLGKSQILKLKQPITKVSVADQSIADVEVLNPTQLLVFGKTIGVERARGARRTGKALQQL